MTTMTCTELNEVACELALDLLDGVERARALAHLETCASCRHEVATLTETAEDLLVLTPELEPPATFAQRIVADIERLGADAVGPEKAARPKKVARRRLLAAAAALVVVVAIAFVPPALRERGTSDRVADMRTGTGHVVGQAALGAGDPASLAVTVPGWAELVRSYGESVDDTYWLSVEHDDGSRQLETLAPTGDNAWTFTIDIPANAISAVSVVDNEGRVWCTARFG